MEPSELGTQKLLDNKTSGKVYTELIEHIDTETRMSVISSQFSIYAFRAMKEYLEKLQDFRFIFTEPTYVRSEEKREVKEFFLAKNKNLAPGLMGTQFEIRLRNEMVQSALTKALSAWIQNNSVCFKSFKTKNTAQPRLIGLKNSKDSLMINGTVDFTTDGLGITNSTRTDVNTCSTGAFATPFSQFFDQLWNNTQLLEDVTADLLQSMRVLYKENTPQFIYFLTLYHLFQDSLDELTEDSIIRTKTGFKETEVWNKLYQFQKDGVMGAIDKLEKYQGCIIADSVGLGKTFSALAIIKYYELRNYRVLVLCPKKLRDNWTTYTLNDKRNLFVNDRFRYDVLNHTDLSRYSGYSGNINLETLNWNNYDLVVIDESHNFRNNPPVKDRVTRYERLMEEVIRSGVQTKVLMLSATPVNNRMNDLKNQIAFITEGDEKALNKVGVKDISEVLRKAQMIFNVWQELPEEERTSDRFVDMMDMEYFKLLDTLTIARSRKHIEKYYSTKEIGKFPLRLRPKNVYSSIDLTGQFPAIGAINDEINRLILPIYAPMEYLLPRYIQFYADKYDIKTAHSVFKQSDREKSLLNLMRVNILKRMESSVHSFTLTVGKILDKTKAVIHLINSHAHTYKAMEEGLEVDEELLSDLEFGENVQVKLEHMDLIRWKEDLLDDKERLERIWRAAKQVSSTKDAKLASLRELIDTKIEQPINPNNRKVVIFSAFADTVDYLYSELAPYFKRRGLHTAMVSGSGGNKSTLEFPRKLQSRVSMKDINNVLTLFSPRSKEKDKVFPDVEEEIDILIATDCISEGQNLQDCDFLVNYDIHWNPVRIIQRFGRIDRIGSINKQIQLVNYWPTEDLDEYINLQQRVKGRMVLVDISATGEENVIEGNKEMRDLQYRKKQLESLKEKVLDLEEIKGGISITDLTFSDFKIELMEYLKKNRQKLASSPEGLYAIARSNSALNGEVEPGVIFALRQLSGAEQTKENNPFYPLYLVYITQEGEVKWTATHAKKILDIYKKLGSTTNEIATDLVALFNRETDDGTDMSAYTDLLAQTIDHIRGKKVEVGRMSLFSSGGTLTSGTEVSLDDYELLTFLIIK